MIALPTPEQVVEAYKATGLRPTNNMFFGQTSRGVPCACALYTYAQTLGHSIRSVTEACSLFGDAAGGFMLGWDFPLYEIQIPTQRLGARSWWTCVESGLLPRSPQILGSYIEHAPADWKVDPDGPHDTGT